jgi:hypothetical protein
MNTELKLEGNKIVDVLFNGKPVKRGFMRGLRKAQETDYWLLYPQSMVAVNLVSGLEMELDAFEYSIFTWCMHWYARYSRGEMAVPIQTFDDMKYLLLEINREAYYNLID